MSMRSTFSVICSAVFCAAAAAQVEKQPLPGQIMVDPENPAFLVYNRDANGDGALDPYFMIGPGDPEGFLYLGERQPDGTRDGVRQQELIERIRMYGGDALYFQVVRSHGGDGRPDHNPWNDPADPASGLNHAMLQQWHGWFSAMREAGIVLFMFVYDDGAHPFDDGCQPHVGAAERAFLEDLVNEFETYPNLIWVVQEEFKFVGHDGQRRPCDEARIARTGAVAALLKEFDGHNHAVGVHHNIAGPMQFPEHPAVDIYVQQADVRPKAGKGNLDTLHAAGQPGHGYDPQRRYVYIMGEGFDWHPKLLAEQAREMLKKSYYATAMSGGYVTVLGMFPTEEGAEPTPRMLMDMRQMQRVFESLPFNRMAPHDELALGGTKWVLADPDSRRYLLYAGDNHKPLGVKNLPKGQYAVRWCELALGENSLSVEEAAGDAVFKTDTIIPGSLLYLSPVEGDEEAERLLELELSHPGPPDPPTTDNQALERVRLSEDGAAFELNSGEPFRPWGFNYVGSFGEVLEEYWDTDWPRAEADFKEMRALGANTVRLHLQVGTYMDSPDAVRPAALERLGKVLALARDTGLYLDLTGLNCFHLDATPAWYDGLGEAERWQVQERFWAAIAKTCAGHTAVFCYDLMNEPIIGDPKEGEPPWLAGELGGMHFVQRISNAPGERSREEIAEAWVKRMTEAIRKEDPGALITVGVIPWAFVWPNAKPLFYGPEIAKHLDFVSIHCYPKSGEIDKALAALKTYEIGKPLVIEEVFPMNCSLAELDQFIEGAPQVDGWISHYFGNTIEEHDAGAEPAGAIAARFFEYWREHAPKP